MSAPPKTVTFESGIAYLGVNRCAADSQYDFKGRAWERARGRSGKREGRSSGVAEAVDHDENVDGHEHAAAADAAAGGDHEAQGRGEEARDVRPVQGKQRLVPVLVVLGTITGLEWASTVVVAVASGCGLPSGKGSDWELGM